ncbi:hypothetical protein FACS1894172_07630 [Spirochaetia bacterium]|nr:hypothetical protein FACS1894172_07630 [Spirochaetia bacterium]
MDNEITIDNTEMVYILLNNSIKNDSKIIMAIEEYDNTDIITIKTKINGKNYNSSGEDYFGTFQKIKDILLKDNIGIKCYGSMENVYPSPMMRTSYNAYILENGKQALMENIVNIFDYVDINTFSTSDEQNNYYNNWLKSIIK